MRTLTRTRGSRPLPPAALRLVGDLRGNRRRRGRCYASFLTTTRWCVARSSVYRHTSSGESQDAHAHAHAQCSPNGLLFGLIYISAERGAAGCCLVWSPPRLNSAFRRTLLLLLFLSLFLMMMVFRQGHPQALVLLSCYLYGNLFNLHAWLFCGPFAFYNTQAIMPLGC